MDSVDSKCRGERVEKLLTMFERQNRQEEEEVEYDDDDESAMLASDIGVGIGSFHMEFNEDMVEAEKEGNVHHDDDDGDGDGDGDHEYGSGYEVAHEDAGADKNQHRSGSLLPQNPPRAPNDRSSPLSSSSSSSSSKTNESRGRDGMDETTHDQSIATTARKEESRGGAGGSERKESAGHIKGSSSSSSGGGGGEFGSSERFRFDDSAEMGRNVGTEADEHDALVDEMYSRPSKSSNDGGVAVVAGASAVTSSSFSPSPFDLLRHCDRDSDNQGKGKSQARGEGAGAGAGAGSGRRDTLYEEAQDFLSISLLIFLYADLRLLSATGRICTKFETLAIASDEAAKSTASRLSGSPNGVAELRSSPPDSSGGGRKDGAGGASGISPAQIMATLLVEVRKEVQMQRRKRKERYGRGGNGGGGGSEGGSGSGGGGGTGTTRVAGRRVRGSRIDDDDDDDDDRYGGETNIFSTILDPEGRNEVEDGMHALLRAYYKMIGRDLKPLVPSVKARDVGQEQSVARAAARGGGGGRFSALRQIPRQSVIQNLRIFSRRNITQQGQGGGGGGGGSGIREGGERVIEEDKEEEEYEGGGESQRQQLRVSPWGGVGGGGGVLSGGGVGPIQGLTRSILPRAGPNVLGGGSGGGATGRSEVALRQYEDVGDAIFKMGGARVAAVSAAEGGEAREGGGRLLPRNQSLSRILTEDELLNHMQEAVESRQRRRLDFMVGFFVEGSVSYLMAKNKFRLVWMNDWYPLKDCTYAVSVHAEKKQVLVVFRGAITRADWGHARDWDLRKVPNPVKGEYDGKYATVKLHSGFYRYLFRERKDTGTTKFDEIVNVIHSYGSDMGGYNVVVTGHSLGGALTTVFGLWASADDRLTKNGPVKMYTFGGPHVGGKTFARTFRHQERVGKIRLARFYNERDGIAHLPISWYGEYRHVGVTIRLPYRRPFFWTCFQKKHKVWYESDAECLSALARAVRSNYLLNMPLPWNIRRTHTLAELQKRLIRAAKAEEKMCKKKTTKQYTTDVTLDELYERLMLKD